MTQENKDLLLKDLCARTPYEVVGKYEIDASYDTSFDTKFQTHKFDAVLYGIKEDLLFVTPVIDDIDEQNFANEEVVDGIDILDFTPYLFPLSVMTEEQEIEYDATFTTIIYEDGRKDSAMTYRSFDWLNKNHFDYRGLIEKGLAIDATNLNVYWIITEN